MYKIRHPGQIGGIKYEIGGSRGRGSSLDEGVPVGRRGGDVDFRGRVETLASAVEEEGVGARGEYAIGVLVDRSLAQGEEPEEES